MSDNNMSGNRKSESKSLSVERNKQSTKKKDDRERDSKKPGVNSDSAPIGGG